MWSQCNVELSIRLSGIRVGMIGSLPHKSVEMRFPCTSHATYQKSEITAFKPQSKQATNMETNYLAQSAERMLHNVPYLFPELNI